MRKYLFAGAAALAFATPAAATNDNSGYVGIEGGIMWPKKQNVQADVVFAFPGTPGPVNFSRQSVGSFRYKRGLDLDFVGGYDFGMFRVEGEFGYKHARAKTFVPDTALITAINTGAGTGLVSTTTDFGIPRSTSVYSAMLNGLLDFGGNGSWGGYAGAGVGYASVHQFGESKGKLAWQLIAGAYAPIGGNLDIGLKYRYFHAGSNRASRTYAFAPLLGATCGGGAFACSSGTVTFYDTSRFTSHSLLASLIYSFGVSAPPPPPPAPPPPPPPEAPATQTCPDGSVILATSTCPAPPPPPPPPPAPTERGERGR